jgi:hypothetical protein
MTAIATDPQVFCVVVVSRSHGWKNARQGLIVLDAQRPARGETGGTDEEAHLSYVESRSMLVNTIDRALRLVPGSRLVVAVPKEQRQFVDEGLVASAQGLVIEQPHDGGSLAATLLSIAHVIEKDPEATVVVMPADQFVHPEDRFLRIVAHATDLARSSRDPLVVLGAVPHQSEADARRILAAPEASGGASSDPGASAIRPHNGLCSRAALLRGELWNTGIMVARAATLWEIGRRVVPDTIRRFNTLRQVIRLVLEGAAPKEHAALALAHVYHGLGRPGSTFDAVQHAKEAFLALPMEGVLWADWPHPERVGRTLEAFLRDEIAARPDIHVRLENNLSARS